MEGVTDNDTLNEQTKLSVKSIYNVKSAIRKVVEEISGTHDGNSGKTADKGKIGTNELKTGTKEGNSGDLGTPIIPHTSTGTHGTHGTSRTPGSHESLESHESDQDLVPAKDVVMVSYPMQDGTPFYFPA